MQTSTKMIQHRPYLVQKFTELAETIAKHNTHTKHFYRHNDTLLNMLRRISAFFKSSVLSQRCRGYYRQTDISAGK